MVVTSIERDKDSTAVFLMLREGVNDMLVLAVAIVVKLVEVKLVQVQTQPTRIALVKIPNYSIHHRAINPLAWHK